MNKHRPAEMSRVVESCAFLAFFLVGLIAAEGLSQDQMTSIDSAARELMRCANIPTLGLSYVSLDGRIRHLRPNLSPDPKHTAAGNVYCIGGATQAFTAVLLAKLLEQNKTFTWDTPVQDIVGHKLALPTRFISSHLNLRDILAMRSGIAGMDIVPLAKPFSKEKLVSSLHKAKEVASFRNKFVYNEVLFSLLEEVVKKLGGDTWWNLLQKHILQPLSMNNTFVAGTRPFSSREFVRGAVYSGNRWIYLDDAAYSGLELVAPAASLCTTPEDMSIWLHFLLSDGQYGRNVIITRTALEATYEAVQFRGQGDPTLQGYRQPALQDSYTREQNSLGWINGLYKGNSFVSQDGSLPGYQSLTTIVPDKNIAVFVAFNGDQDEKHFGAKVLLNILGLDYLLQGYSRLTSHNICSALETLSAYTPRSSKEEDKHVANKTASTQRPPEEYVGLFTNNAYGDVHVKLNDSQDSSLTLEYGMAIFTLEPISNTTFQLIAKGGSLKYRTNADFYKNNQRIFAEFSFSVTQMDERIITVSIDGFDKHYVPVFSTQLSQHFEEYEEYRCSAPALVTYQCFILLLSALVFFR